LKKYLYVLAVIFVTAVILRLYPFLIGGLPYSTDGWSCIRNTELLIQNSPVSLGDAGLFDGYNTYWPANSLFGAVFSEVTGLAPMDAMAFGVPLAGALTIPLFFVLVRKITENTKIALIAAVLLATAYPYIQFTAGVTKETFANPIYVSVLLIFLLKPSWKRTLLFSAASAALVLSHHLTAFLTIGFLAFLTCALFYSKNNRFGSSVKQNVGLLAVISAITGVYFGFFAFKGLSLTLSVSDLLAVGAYQVLVFSAALFFTAKTVSRSRRFLAVRCLAVLGLACCFVLFLTQKALVPAAPTLPLHYFLFFIPYLIIIPLVTFGFGGLHERQSSLLIPVFWLAPLIAFGAYAVFSSSPMGLTLTYRVLNFLVLPLFVLAGIAFYKLYVHSKRLRAGRILALGIGAAVLVAASAGPCGLYASVSLQEPYLGYFWLYRTPEISACQWTAASLANQSVAGDMKISYLLKGYFNVNTDVAGGFQFLSGSGSKPSLLLVYPEMSTNGYVVYSGNVMALPQNWTSKLHDLNQVYSNNMVNLYAK
jgi:hypothetical protein